MASPNRGAPVPGTTLAASWAKSAASRLRVSMAWRSARARSRAYTVRPVSVADPITSARMAMRSLARMLMPGPVDAVPAPAEPMTQVSPGRGRR